jgi:hypothetical protein
MNGRGIIVFPDGKVYKGQVEDNICTKGKFETPRERRTSGHSFDQHSTQER